MKKEILAQIKQAEKIIIHRHIRPDPDAMGSQCGLAEIIKASYPDKKVITVGESDPSLEFLYKMDEIDDSEYEKALVIVCDTANQERISDQRYKKGLKLIKIDHHPNADPYGDLLWVDTDASSVSEMIYEFYLSGREEGLLLNDKAAELIFAGIVGDTGRFLFPSTSKKTFEYAAELAGYEFNRSSLYTELYKVKPNAAKMSGYVLQNFSMSSSGAASMIIKNETLEKYGVTASQASQLVSLLGEIEGIKAWVLFVEEKDQIRVRFRSKKPVINELARKYGGGGHPFASGASIYSWEEADRILEDLESLCQSDQ
ncbi:bifunctional oligoribonuclease/PAP phosphatase NrnA [Metabacillus sp. GX 13764]|uniref:DHH family phosphoesterase n=1 Tax=Metabacillus kandeliae TaxID=2900151 RepID=UPI001E49799D|nr:bifunctional oligoribonuclease/PAP phosphatase NrnA [Metabacillus kandeliae]MCD7032785.1 bifunctional oligoribonuclease/PAP phosphatase NrnA [Metabacillus kandeliae]